MAARKSREYAIQHGGDGVRMTVLCFMVFTASVAFAAAKSWTPADNQIAELEASVRLEKLPGWLPSEAPSLARYDRYYAGSTVEGKKVILGEFVVPEDPGHAPGIHIVANKDEFPRIEGGGCTIVNVIYSPTRHKVISIWCNGAI